MYGVQFRGTLQPNQSQRWFTYNWPANNDVSWMVLPTTAQAGSPHVGFASVPGGSTGASLKARALALPARDGGTAPAETKH
jgi:hypothetical protein